MTEAMSHHAALSLVLEQSAEARDVATGALAPAAFRRAVDAWITGGLPTRMPSSSLLLLRIDWPTTGAGQVVRPGRQESGQVLGMVAGLIAPAMRNSDVLGRLDTDTLGVLLPHTPTLQAEQVSRRLRAIVSERSRGAGRPVTVSVGMSSALLHEPWLRATQALAEAQRGGRCDRTVISGVEPIQDYAIAA